jgi:predicted RNA polymerase sigma factor
MAELYDMLDRIAPSPLNALNRAVAEAYLHSPQDGLERLAAVLREHTTRSSPGHHESRTRQAAESVPPPAKGWRIKWASL